MGKSLHQQRRGTMAIVSSLSRLVWSGLVNRSVCLSWGGGHVFAARTVLDIPTWSCVLLAQRWQMQITGEDGGGPKPMDPRAPMSISGDPIASQQGGR